MDDAGFTASVEPAHRLARKHTRVVVVVQRKQYYVVQSSEINNPPAPRTCCCGHWRRSARRRGRPTRMSARFWLDLELGRRVGVAVLDAVARHTHVPALGAAGTT